LISTVISICYGLPLTIENFSLITIRAKNLLILLQIQLCTLSFEINKKELISAVIPVCCDLPLAIENFSLVTMRANNLLILLQIQLCTLSFEINKKDCHYDQADSRALLCDLKNIF
jgi:hypothetical protein